MTTVTLPKTAVAVSGATKGVLGFIVWSGFGDAEVPLRTLQHQWRMAGLPAAVLPKETRALDSFKRAVSSLEGHKGIDRTTDIHVDKVVETAEDCVYQVAFVVRDVDITDARKSEARYPRACKFIFNKTTEESPKMAVMGEVDKRDLLPIGQHVLDAFDQGLTRVHGSRVRALIREYIRTDYDEKRGSFGLGGENMAEGNSAIYFVQAKHRDELVKLQEFVRALAKTQRSYGFLNYVPMADGSSEREMVRRHLMSNVDAALEKAISEAKAHIAKNRAGDRKQALRQDRISNMFRDYNTLLGHARSYEHILADESAAVQAKADILRRQLDALL